jgi:hypothetical protein
MSPGGMSQADRYAPGLMGGHYNQAGANPWAQQPQTGTQRTIGPPMMNPMARMLMGQGR